MRVGIASGSAIIGMMGARRQAYTALGDRVNLAKRLEEVCPPGKVCIDEATYQGVRPFFLAAKLRSSSYARQADQELLDRMEALEARLAAQGESPQVLYELGKTYYQLNDAIPAIRNFKRALELDPGEPGVLLARIYIVNNRKLFPVHAAIFGFIKLLASADGPAMTRIHEMDLLQAGGSFQLAPVASGFLGLPEAFGSDHPAEAIVQKE